MNTTITKQNEKSQIVHKPYGPYEKYFKRPLDILCGLAAVIVFCWLYLILIILGVVFMRGNPFFTQDRPGKNEKIFKLIKFRTMDNRKDENGNTIIINSVETRCGDINIDVNGPKAPNQRGADTWGLSVYPDKIGDKYNSFLSKNKLDYEKYIPNEKIK